MTAVALAAAVIHWSTRSEARHTGAGERSRRCCCPANRPRGTLWGTGCLHQRMPGRAPATRRPRAETSGCAAALIGSPAPAAATLRTKTQMAVRLHRLRAPTRSHMPTSWYRGLAARWGPAMTSWQTTSKNLLRTRRSNPTRTFAIARGCPLHRDPEQAVLNCKRPPAWPQVRRMKTLRRPRSSTPPAPPFQAAPRRHWTASGGSGSCAASPPQTQQGCGRRCQYVLPRATGVPRLCCSTSAPRAPPASF
mmetsp:Transcript_71814/g.208042  ORF Transcript_71814/g.208042 Transcript_71814/m.208042 type:complete len:250 (-) Transcript_71814:898-1647(-)